MTTTNLFDTTNCQWTNYLGHNFKAIASKEVCYDGSPLYAGQVLNPKGEVLTHVFGSNEKQLKIEFQIAVEEILGIDNDDNQASLHTYEYNVHGHPMQLDVNGQWVVGAESPAGMYEGNKSTIIWDVVCPDKQHAMYWDFNVNGCIGVEGQPLPFNVHEDFTPCY